MEDRTYSKGELYREILSFKRKHNLKEYSLLEVIMIYCEELEVDVDEVGEIIKKDKRFVDALKGDLKYNNEAVFVGEKKDGLGEWI